MPKKENEEVIQEREEEIASFLQEIKGLEDFRSKQGRSYTLAEIFLLVLCAQLCGFESLREYETYGTMKLELLRKFLPYHRGSPSKSTIARVLSIFSPAYIEKLLMSWMSRIVQTYEEQKQIAIDGEWARGTSPRASRKTVQEPLDSFLRLQAEQIGAGCGRNYTSAVLAV